MNIEIFRSLLFSTYDLTEKEKEEYDEMMEEYYSEEEDDFPSLTYDEVRELADETGLSYKSIKKSIQSGRKFKVLINSPDEFMKASEDEISKTMSWIFLNNLVERGFQKEICESLTSVEEIITKAVKENKGKKCEFADNYNSWFKLGMNIKFFHPDEKGLNLFKSISALSKKYKEDECEKFWEKLEPEYGNVGIIINLIKKSENEEKFEIPKDRKKFLQA